jgi:hypothetical protein
MLVFSQAQASVTAATGVVTLAVAFLAAGVVAFLSEAAADLAAGSAVGAAAYKILVVVAFGLAVPVFDTKQ